MRAEFGLGVLDGRLLLEAVPDDGAPFVWDMTADEARHLVNALGEGIRILYAARYGADA